MRAYRVWPLTEIEMSLFTRKIRMKQGHPFYLVLLTRFTIQLKLMSIERNDRENDDEWFQDKDNRIIVVLFTTLTPRIGWKWIVCATLRVEAKITAYSLESADKFWDGNLLSRLQIQPTED